MTEKLDKEHKTEKPKKRKTESTFLNLIFCPVSILTCLLISFLLNLCFLGLQCFNVPSWTCKRREEATVHDPPNVKSLLNLVHFLKSKMTFVEALCIKGRVYFLKLIINGYSMQYI